MVSTLLWSVLFGPPDLRIVLLSVALAHDVVMFPVLFFMRMVVIGNCHGCVPFSLVVSKG
jgi:hypothetical protein